MQYLHPALRFRWIWSSIALGLFAFAPAANAEPSFFNNSCAECHTDDTRTCNGCHNHRRTLQVSSDLLEYEPGAQVLITLDGGDEHGWIRGLLYDSDDNEIDRKSGPSGTGDDGLGDPVTFPVTLEGTAPLVPGDYVWNAAWFGSLDNQGATHGESRKAITITVIEGTSGVEDYPWPYEFLGWGELKKRYR